ncbi:alpha/beta fold hydrolase [Brevundimonas sp. DC300-4]|uniref:alpha/beta fold hydrolase n=1 Tax=Brevundimonas sp. DC300-4 TaxID=2804594 RepID=UPI003CEA9F92
MFSRAFPACRRPRAWFAIIVGVFVACIVANDQAHAEPAGASQTAPFASDRLSVEVFGSGPDVILIPGLASSREVWRPLATRLAATHRVHLVQLAGFAGEPWNHGDGPFVTPEVEELARYIAVLGLDHPAVIGHSMGGAQWPAAGPVASGSRRPTDDRRCPAVLQRHVRPDRDR